MELKPVNFHQRYMCKRLNEVLILFETVVFIILLFGLYVIANLDYWFCLVETILISIFLVSIHILVVMTSMYIRIDEKMIAVKGYKYTMFLEESDVVSLEIKDIVSLDFEIIKRKYKAKDFEYFYYGKLKISEEEEYVLKNEFGKIYMIITDKEGNNLKILINEFKFETLKNLLITLKEALKIKHNQYYKDIDPDKIIEELSNNMDNPMESTYRIN